MLHAGHVAPTPQVKEGFQVFGWVSTLNVLNSFTSDGLRCMLATPVCWLHQRSEKTLHDREMESSCRATAITAFCTVRTQSQTTSNASRRIAADAHVIRPFHLTILYILPRLNRGLDSFQKHERILHRATATPSRSLHVQRPENLGSDDEAGLHIRRRVGLPKSFVGCLEIGEHVCVSDDALIFYFEKVADLLAVS